jgi:hypothetical protein
MEALRWSYIVTVGYGCDNSDVDNAISRVGAVTDSDGMEEAYRKKLIRGSSGGLSMVKLEQSSKTLAANDRAIARRGIGRRFRKEEFIVASLVRSLGIVDWRATFQHHFTIRQAASFTTRRT